MSEIPSQLRTKDTGILKVEEERATVNDLND